MLTILTVILAATYNARAALARFLVRLARYIMTPNKLPLLLLALASALNRHEDFVVEQPRTDRYRRY